MRYKITCEPNLYNLDKNIQNFIKYDNFRG